MTANKSRIRKILHGIIKRNYQNLTWQASNFAIKSLDRELIDLMIASKMTSAKISIEAGTQRIQRLIKKNLDLNKAEELYHTLERHNIPIHLNFMIGFPMETRDEILQTLDFAKRMGAHGTQINIVTPWPGSEMYEQALANGQLDKNIPLDDFDHRKAVGFVNVPWDYSELKDLAYDTNIYLNFLNNRDLRDSKNYKRLLTTWKNFEIGLPKHVVLFICLGYLCKRMEMKETGLKYYHRAMELLTEENCRRVYGKYLGWEDNMIIQDFNKFFNSYIIKSD